jgi:hypothetical protein
MRGLNDCNPNSARRMLIRALPEWPAAIPFLPVLAVLVWLTCRL